VAEEYTAQLATKPVTCEQALLFKNQPAPVASVMVHVAHVGEVALALRPYTAQLLMAVVTEVQVGSAANTLV